MLREALLRPIRGQPSELRLPEAECRMVIDDSDGRTALERWLLNWSPDSDAYASGRVAVERLASVWRVRFRDARSGNERIIDVPVVGTPVPPGWKG